MSAAIRSDGQVPGTTDPGQWSSSATVRSLRNPLVQLARRLHRAGERAAQQRFLVEGVRTVTAALDASAPLETLMLTAAAAERHPELRTRAVGSGVQVLIVTEQIMRAVATTVTPPGVLATARTVTVPVTALPAHPNLVCVLDQTRDPGNLGTVLRTADAVGADAVATTAGSVHAESPKAVRSAAGSLFHLPVVDGAPWPELRDALHGRGLQLVGADARGELTPADLDPTAVHALVLGSEAHGLSDEIRADCDVLVRLPMPGRAESLNLAAAAAILLHQLTSTRPSTVPPGSTQELP